MTNSVTQDHLDRLKEAVAKARAPTFGQMQIIERDANFHRAITPAIVEALIVEVEASRRTNREAALQFLADEGQARGEWGTPR